MPSCDMPLAKRATVRAGRLRIELVDGRVLNRPLCWFPIVAIAPANIQRKVRVINAGTGIAWTHLGYELGVGGLTRQSGPLK